MPEPELRLAGCTPEPPMGRGPSFGCRSGMIFVRWRR